MRRQRTGAGANCLAMEAEGAQRHKVICKVDDLQTDGWVIRRDLSKSERLTRSGRIFGCFFLVACITVFVPFLHFILPPLLLITGGILAAGEYGGTGEILEGEITCPNCAKVMNLPRETEEWPRHQRCTGCSFSLDIELLN
jgi:hypothetical protein